MSRKYIRSTVNHGLLTRYAILRVVHAPGMPVTFSKPHRVSNPDLHHTSCVTDVSWCMPASLTSGFLWSRWWGKHFAYLVRSPLVIKRCFLFVCNYVDLLCEHSNIYLRLLFFNIDMAQVFEIHPCGSHRPVYPMQWMLRYAWQCDANDIGNHGAAVDLSDIPASAPWQ